MSSPPSDTAPSPGSNSPPPPKSSAPPPSNNSSSPPPPKNSAPPPDNNNSPPTTSSPPPPPTPSSGSFSPPPPKSDNPSPPPPPGSASNNPSPPPPQRSSSTSSSPPPPLPVTSSNTDSSASASSDSSALSPATVKQLVVGATLGIGLFLLAMVVVCMICAKRNKKRKHDHEHNVQYYSDPSRKDHGNNKMYYNNTPQQPNWHMPQAASTGGWASPPAPPPLPPGLLPSGEAVSTSGAFSAIPPLPPPSPALSLGFNKSTFTYDELAAATEGFSQANLLGQGGFGYVHKGVLPSGKEVAVKSLKSGSGQGEREFQAEVEIISRVHHRHLVSLVGYCIAGGQRMLVYDFVSNGTLEHHLYGKDLPTMEWATRLRIATGSAKGLAYLHEDCHPRIIHRDIKTANILLDDNFEAMVADFGLAKLSSDNYTHVSTRVMGTFGYLAPEYASSGKLTEKSDVFSFGVMLLELITGRRPVDPTSAYMEDSLVDWARPLLQHALEDGVYEELVDPRLESAYNPNEMARMIASASASIRHSAKKRPKMSQIVRALEGDVSLDDLNEGVKPGHSSIYASSTSSEYDTMAYNADIKKFRRVLVSQEFGSSEFGTSSSDSREIPNPTIQNHSPNA